MKKDDMMIVAGAALAVFLFYRYMNKGAAPATSATPTAESAGNGWASLMQTWQGWQYFSDGTVIGPDGTYYSNGVAVYRP